jgi:hypothetical protein
MCSTKLEVNFTLNIFPEIPEIPEIYNTAVWCAFELDLI